MMFSTTYFHEDTPTELSDYDCLEERVSENDSDIWPRKPHINIARKELVKFSRALIDGSSTSCLDDASKMSNGGPHGCGSDDTWPGTLPQQTSPSSSSLTYNKYSPVSTQGPKDWLDVAMLAGSPCFCLAGKAITPVVREDELPKRRQLHNRYTSIPIKTNDEPIEDTVQINFYVVDYKKKHEQIRAKWTYRPTRASLLRDHCLGKKYKCKQNTVSVRNLCTQTDGDIEAIVRKYADIVDEPTIS